ncbi:MAG TPA: DegT/DnrJ/EryC1/StrS aminotransferase family protein [Bacteroidota bacterium]|nr:DegT/DnrJ/EryC1/StrS aminotransferase family protein [Bacteroidota bacterium]
MKVPFLDLKPQHQAIRDEVLAALAATYDATRFCLGKDVEDFEKGFSAKFGYARTLGMNSGTSPLHIGSLCGGFGPGDEVITTPFTFASSCWGISYVGAKPVFVDIDPSTFNMNPRALHAALTKKTKAIIPVHIAGLPADLDEIHEAASKHGIPVIEDAAHAFPSKYKGKMIGSLSQMTCFSFYATKTITTGEGGMLCTESDEFADRCRIMSLHGISKDAWKRYTAEGSWFYEIVAPGYKYNMTDVAAAMGLAQLRKAGMMLDRRRSIAQMFTSAFSRFPQLQPPVDDARHQHAWHLYMLRLNLDRLTIDRARFIEELKKRNIGASVHFIPLHIHPYYRDLYGYKPEEFPVAYAEYLREVSLPIYSKMSDSDVEDVIDAVLDIIIQFMR